MLDGVCFRSVFCGFGVGLGGCALGLVDVYNLILILFGLLHCCVG